MQSNSLSKEELINACANFQTLINTPELLVKNAGNFSRAIRLPVADVQAVLAQTKGDYVNVYCGVLGDVDGDHFIFMAPGMAAEAKVGQASLSKSMTMALIDDAVQPVILTAAVPECIGKIPPCPPIQDDFIQ